MGRQPEQDDSETETEPEELSADPKQELWQCSKLQKTYLSSPCYRKGGIYRLLQFC